MQENQTLLTRIKKIVAPSVMSFAVVLATVTSSVSAAPPYTGLTVGENSFWNYNLPAGIEPIANPNLPEDCTTLRVSIMVDKSSSIAEDEINDMREAISSFITSVDSANFPVDVNYNFVTFGNVANFYPSVAANTSAPVESIWLTGTQASQAITSGDISKWAGESGYASQQPYNTPNTDFFSGNFATNWDGAFQTLNLRNLALESNNYPTSNVVLMVTDGNPSMSQYEADRALAPDNTTKDGKTNNAGAGPDDTNGGAPTNDGLAYADEDSEAHYELLKAVQGANNTKNGGTPVYVFGVGLNQDTNVPPSISTTNIQMISGEEEDQDYFLSEFDALGQNLSSIIPALSEACTPPPPPEENPPEPGPPNTGLLASALAIALAGGSAGAYLLAKNHKAKSGIKDSSEK